MDLSSEKDAKMSAAGEKEPLLQKGEVEGTTKVKDVTVKLTKDPSSAKNASGKNRQVRLTML